jgi:hypothetical protein
MDQHSDGHHVVDIQLGCINGTGEPTSANPPADGSDLNVPASSPPPASKEGNVGSNWYHGDTAAYTHDEEQHHELEGRDGDSEKPEPRYYVWVRAPSK